jgi:magnesium-transporting ATPase (P-type)
MELFMAAVGLAVAAIPEGLPAIMTIALAIGVRRMAGRHAVIRRLPAVETLGSVTVICSDKTGTLTRNEMTVQQVVLAGGTLDVEGAGYAPLGALRRDGIALLEPAGRLPALRELAEVAALCNDAMLHERDGQWQLSGDPTEGALLCLAMKVGLNPAELALERPRLEVIPFESEHRYMATLHPASSVAGDAHNIALLKGAPERVIAMCSAQLTDDGNEQALDAAYWHAAIDRQARAGRRVLALARRRLPAAQRELDPYHVAEGLTLIGLVGIIDPPREEAARAVTQCHNAGIRVLMITGDHGVTASAIAAQLGIQGDLAAVTGPELEALDEAALRALVARTQVFARASPEHKLRLVRALQANGEVVAMTGDGVNDAPALKAAHIGLAMAGGGTDVAREAAAISLLEDDIGHIVDGIRMGRRIFDNLRKVLLYIVAIHVPIAGLALLPVLLGWPPLLLPNLPITPAPADLLRSSRRRSSRATPRHC